MARGEVNIELRASGANKVAGEFGKIGKASTDLIVNVKKIGNVFGELGGQIGGILQNILKGGIWGIAAEVAKSVMGLYGKWRTAQEAAMKEAREKTDELAKANERLASSVKEVAKASADSQNAFIKMRDEELKKTLELEKAEIRLRKERAIAAGMKQSDADEWETRKLKRIDSEAAAQAINNRLDDAEQRVAQALADADMAGHAAENAEAIRQQLKREYQDAEDKAAKSAIRRLAAPLVSYAPGGFANVRQFTDEDRAKAAAEARESFANSKEGKELAKRIADFEASGLKNAMKAKEEADRAVASARHDLGLAEKSADIFLMERQSDKYAKTRQKAEERKNAELAAQKQIAQERIKADLEAHNRRMAQLKEEMEAERKRGDVQKSIAATASAEFDRAFAMFRDPARAAAEIGEEKAYAKDLERLHRTAASYGGKWRIDELSRLMAAGDTQGITDTLGEWRRSKGFTPEVESMVRASAVERTRTTAEDELRKISTNTEGLARKLEELISMKGG